MAEQGPLEDVSINYELQQEVFSQVIEILRTLFAWFDLPWRDLTYENMFEKAKELRKVDKE